MNKEDLKLDLDWNNNKSESKKCCLFVDLDGTIINSVRYDRFDSDKYIMLDHRNYKIAYVISKDDIVKFDFIRSNIKIVAVTSRGYEISEKICNKLKINDIICENGFEYFKRDDENSEYYEVKEWRDILGEDIIKNFKNFPKLIKELENLGCTVVWESMFLMDLFYYGSRTKFDKFIEKFRKLYSDDIIIFESSNVLNEVGIKFTVYFKNVSKGDAIKKFINNGLMGEENYKTLSAGDNIYTDSHMFEVTDMSIGLKNSGATVEFSEEYAGDFDMMEFTKFLLDYLTKEITSGNIFQ